MKRLFEFRAVRSYIVQEDAVLLSDADKVVKFYNETISKASWFDPEKECAVLLCLNRKNRILCFNLISIGSAIGTCLSPREVMRAALISGATAFMILHNHPSGDPCPSSADTTVTNAIREAAKTVDLAFIDHVIIGNKQYDPIGVGYYSFRNAGII